MVRTQRASGTPSATPVVLARLWAACGRQGIRSYLAVLSGALMLANLYLIFMVAPTESSMGHVQRVFYFHVPIAIMSFLAFFVVFVASVTYLAKRGGFNYVHIPVPVPPFRLWLRIPIPGRPERWDSLAHSSAEVGVVFVTLALITGSIWARGVWGLWWNWEPRLTTTLILWLIYVSYLMVRAYAPNRSRAAVYSAVVGIIGFVDVPIVYLSVVWWGVLFHPEPMLGPLAEPNSVNGTMYGVFLFSFLTFLFLFVYLMLERKALRDAEDQVREMRFSLRQLRR